MGAPPTIVGNVHISFLCMSITSQHYILTLDLFRISGRGGLIYASSCNATLETSSDRVVYLISGPFVTTFSSSFVPWTVQCLDNLS